MSLHKRLRPYTYEFLVEDSSVWVKKQDFFISSIHTFMRDDGYVPVLDLNPYVTVEYRELGETFAYKVTVHGMYVGRKKAWETQGWAMGKLLPISTQVRRSKPSSEQSVSE